ncbi:MAG: glycoside hydrolase family 25 protein [Lachnospiraceae bacterium]|nr:glycoside hydrolase family 25 protein [Lachnospiraceae bacterium]
MDFKLKWKIFLLFFLFIVGMLAIVLIVNYDRLSARFSSSGQKFEVNQEDLIQTEKEGLSDFLNDETFFDKDVSKDVSYKEGQNGLYDLLVTSVEKDLRIKIVDLFGEPVVGQEFYVTLQGEGLRSSDGTGAEYKDLDQDGIIYIGGLQAGEYYVSLNHTDAGASNSRIRVAVRDKVEYTVINDISYLIKSEEDVDPSIEDTEEKGALAEADTTQITTPFLSEKTEFGIDVSKWNKEIDWQKVKESGVEYAIIRCGYRGSSSGYLIEDPLFQQNIKGATEAGIKVGLYFFTQAVSEVEAVEEASMAIALCDQYKLEYPIFIDSEGAGGNGRADYLEKDTRTSVCRAFCETIVNSGYSAGVYASKNWLLQNLLVSQLEGYAIWLAEYKAEATYNGDYHMWQYTSDGAIDGIEGRVDLNVSYLVSE